MKTIITLLFIFAAVAQAKAFDLPAVNTAALRGAPAAELPAVKLAAARGPEIDLASDWSDLRAGFFRAEVPKELYSLPGVYTGHLHPLYEREDYTVDFTMTIYRDEATGEIKAAFPMPPNYGLESITLKLTKSGAEFADAWGGRARLVIRKSGGKLYIFSNLYSDETYGVAQEAGEKAQNAYVKLAADFERGAAPAKEDLLAWNAGRIYGKDYPEYPGAILLAGWDVPAAAASGAVFKLVALTPGVSPAFYEDLDPFLVPGLKVLLNEAQTNWSAPEFYAGGVKFEKILPSYEKGFSRYEVRQTADKRLILKNVWKSDLGGSVTSGTDYAILTRNVTPK